MENTTYRGMIEATRLTRAGQLGDAAALIQNLLRGGTAPSGTPTEPRAPIVIDNAIGEIRPKGVWGALRKLGLGRESDLGDLAPPPAATPAEITPDGARFLSGAHAEQAGRLEYKLFVPGGYRGKKLPLVVMLHGCNQSPDDFAAGTRMNGLAQEQGFIVLYPAQSQAANASKCWNWFNPRDQQRGQGEPALIAGMTRQIMRDHSVDPSRIYVAGLSAGGAAAAVMGMAYPDVYAAVGVHSGLACGAAHDMPSAFAAMRQGNAAAMRQGNAAAPPAFSGARAADDRTIPTIVFHGDRDTTVNPSNGDQIIQQSKAAGTSKTKVSVLHGQAPDGHAYERTLHSEAGGRVTIEHWVIRGAGHAWSGGSPAGSFTDPKGPDASREMLRFFLQHRLGKTAPNSK